MPAKPSKPANQKSTKTESNPLDLESLVSLTLKRRQGLTIDASKAGGGMGAAPYDADTTAYGVARHAGSLEAMPRAVESHVGSLVDYQRLKPTISSNGALRHPWELYFQAFLDGYAVAQALTATGKSKGAQKKVGSKGAVTQFVKSAAERSDVALTGTLAPVFEAVLGEFITLYGEGLRKPVAAAFVTGAKLRCTEYGVQHPLLDALFDGPKKVKGAAIPKGKAAANEELISAIMAKPDDDAPRLVYADYLTQSGDPRGEFIQLQCSVGNVAGYAPRAPTKSVENADALVKRIDTLLKHSRGQWLDGIKLATVSWSRGFPQKGTIEAAQFIASRAIDRLPLEELHLHHWNGKLAEAMFKRAKHPTAHRFWFGSGFGPKVLHVMGAPVFAEATVLEAGFWELGPIPQRALEVFAASKFANLEVVEGPAELFATLALASCPRLHTYKVTEGWQMEPALTTALWSQVKRIEIYRFEEDTDFSPLKSATSVETLSMVRDELGEASARQLVELAPKSLKTLEGGFTELAPGLVKLLKARFELKPFE